MFVIQSVGAVFVLRLPAGGEAACLSGLRMVMDPWGQDRRDRGETAGSSRARGKDSWKN